MKNIAIINGINLSSYAEKPLFDGKSSISLVHQFSKSLPDIEKRVVLSSSNRIKGEGIEMMNKKKWNTSVLLKAIDTLASGYDNIFYFYEDTPFLDPELAKKMFINHIKYMADYTFADGYPYGFAVEIIKSDIVKRFISLNKEETHAITRQSIFEIIKKDINSFDIETELAPQDQRMLRVWLCADTKRNYLLLQRIASQGRTDSKAVCTLLDKQPEILRTLPAFYSIQVTGGCAQQCSYCPFPVFGKKNGMEITENKDEMEPEKFKQIIKKIMDFSEDAVISISLWGEPSFHSRIEEIVKAVVTNGKLSLIIETSGIGWKPGVLSGIAGIDANPPTWIISLDAWTSEVYDHVRGNGFKEGYETARMLLGICKDKLYVQAVRMKENEDDLEHFYKNWQKETEKIIIQKYDSFCGLLPERKVTDLSPLKRFPCWHIKRDINILIDGTVPLCREDTSGGIILGNVFKDTLQEIWGKGEQYYNDHLSGDYPELCRKCDEYYTYNF